jgi:DNA (cytosine-5)-methyltransferase 1
MICISNRGFDNIDFNDVVSLEKERYIIPAELTKLLSVLEKNLYNEKRFPKYVIKHSSEILNCITEVESDAENYDISIIERLKYMKQAMSCRTLPKNDDAELESAICEIKERLTEMKDVLSYILSLEKMLETMGEIENNRLIGEYIVRDDEKLYFKVNSYSVNDYISAILGGEYIQIGNTVNAEWFGVPQERRRHIVLGIRKDLYQGKIELPQAPEKLVTTTVGQAIMDLAEYDVCFEREHPEMKYDENDEICEYAKMMRNGSTGVKNHITTKTTEVALERFKNIKPGGNFHDLKDDMKSTYSKPERTQNTIYLRLNPDEPSGTVVNVRKSMWIHPTLDRAITVREAARLQSFPDKFVFTGTKDSQFQQVGNAVPPLLAKGIAEQLLKYI